ncbi:sigma-70 family RNA polymerase sigma factor [Rhabdobacter roseus]|uniref:RNA polymerase sigma factor (Sigma-70 family) n=1 Tax=Rhabdobacter roseus TaxID=1655419 RepID=A0A840TVM6_9BACT|nr:sigma-70 family RNA polymerase sigma factor [Rhabdobacter roseus]MBB5285632.1 RNA polymerase sigma factor (sigma-70 family) [Rhabdobacter roseus]
MPLSTRKNAFPLRYRADTDLWSAFRQGDRVALGKLYDAHIQELLSYGYRITNDRQLIKDSIQDLFLHLWNHRQNLSDTDSVKFYLYRSLRNRILRNTDKHPSLGLDAERLPTLSDLPFESEWILQETKQEQLNKLRLALATLPKRQQEAIQLRYYHDFDPEEIAQLMQINNQSVRNLLHLALHRLRDRFGILLLIVASVLEVFKKM